MRGLKYAAAALTFGVAASAAAQTTSPPPTPPTSPYEHRQVPSHKPGDPVVPQHGVMQPPQTGDQNVIQPKSQSQAPTPTIPPPGTPGGNQNVQPK